MTTFIPLPGIETLSGFQRQTPPAGRRGVAMTAVSLAVIGNAYDCSIALVRIEAVPLATALATGWPR